MSSRLSLYFSTIRLGIAAVGLATAMVAHAQVELPPIPFVGEEPPTYSASSCLIGEYENPNYDAWDPCCNPPLGTNRPAYCPAPVNNPFDVFESDAETAFTTVLRNSGLDGLLDRIDDNAVRAVAEYLASQVIDAAWDYVFDFLNGNTGSSTGAGAVTVPQLHALLARAGDRLTSVMLMTVAAITDDPLFQLKTGAAYRLPFVAGPAIKGVCQESGEHRERSFDLGVMNGTANNGVFTFTTQAGVPTEIKANRPSWTSRQIWDFRWLWWFGDAVMVPQSAEDDAYTVHTYPFIDDYTLSFVMLKNDLELWFNFSAGPDGFSYSKIPGLSLSDEMFPDACNYGTMRVLENNRPSAVALIGGTGETNQRRFNATGSSDPDGNALTYLWTLSDGATIRAPIFTKIYDPSPVRRTDTVQLTVSDGAKMHTITKTFFIPPTSCISGGRKRASC